MYRYRYEFIGEDGQTSYGRLIPDTRPAPPTLFDIAARQAGVAPSDGSAWWHARRLARIAAQTTPAG
jgi:hypothetical protein